MKSCKCFTLAITLITLSMLLSADPHGGNRDGSLCEDLYETVIGVIVPGSLHAHVDDVQGPSDFMIKIHDANSAGLAVSNRGELGC